MILSRWLNPRQPSVPREVTDLAERSDRRASVVRRRTSRRRELIREVNSMDPLAEQIKKAFES